MDLNWVDETVLASVFKNCPAAAGLRRWNNTGHDPLNIQLPNLKHKQRCTDRLRAEKQYF